MSLAFRLLIATLISSAAASALGEEPGLPRVLILGDVVYQQPARDVAKELQGKAEVVFASPKPGEVRNTTTTLQSLDAILGERDWDVIHFNLGLGDLVYRAPRMKSFRVMPLDAGGVRATSPDVYEKNLRELVERLQATNATLIWASTTPIRHSSTRVFAMGSEVDYNAVAKKVMAEKGIKINDMYRFVFELIDMKRPASHGADPFFFDRKPLHPPIVRSIAAELESR